MHGKPMKINEKQCRDQRNAEPTTTMGGGLLAHETKTRNKHIQNPYIQTQSMKPTHEINTRNKHIQHPYTQTRNMKRKHEINLRITNMKLTHKTYTYTTPTHNTNTHNTQHTKPTYGTSTRKQHMEPPHGTDTWNQHRKSIWKPEDIVKYPRHPEDTQRKPSNV